MNNIKEFLLDNYIWILVVILLAIITVAGFLADKSKNSSKGKASKEDKPPLNAATLSQDSSNTANTMPVNNLKQEPLAQPQPELNTQSVPPQAPVMPVPPETSPVVENQGPMTMSQVINQVGANQVTPPNQYNQGYPSTYSSFPQGGNNQGVETPPMTENQVPISNNPNPQPAYATFSNQGPSPVAPQPVAPQPINPQPINPQPIYQQAAPQPVPPQQVAQQVPQQAVPQQVPQQAPQQVPPQPTMSQPISFVYGPKNNIDNQNGPQ